MGEKMCEEGGGGEVAGDFAGGGSAHAIADDEGAGDGVGCAGVFVAGADETGVGEHGVNDSICLHSLGRDSL